MRRPPRSLEPGGNQAGRKHEQDEWNQIGQIQRQGEAGECQAVPLHPPMGFPGREGQAETPTAAR